MFKQRLEVDPLRLPELDFLERPGVVPVLQHLGAVLAQHLLHLCAAIRAVNKPSRSTLPDDVCSLWREVGDGDLLPPADAHLGPHPHHAARGDEEPVTRDP